MSVSFQGIKGRTLDLNNGLASRLLDAIGYGVGEATHGQMPIQRALEGIERAKKSVAEEDAKYLVWLGELAQGVADAKGRTLTWF